MTIKSKNANDEALPPLCDAPPLRPDEDRIELLKAAGLIK
jgi:hypothetical protein